MKEHRREKVMKCRPSWKKTSQVKKIRIVMTAVLVILILSAAAGGTLAWIQLHPAPPPEEEPVSSIASSEPEEETEPVYDDEDNLLVVNVSRPLPETFLPVPVEVHGIEVDRRVEKPLLELLQDAEAAGLSLSLVQGYVDAETQDQQYREKVNELVETGMTQVRAESDARELVPPGGCSEYQTGMLIQFSAENAEDFSETREYRWLVENGVKYGFILRFPENKTQETQTPYQPSCFRYVGKEHAMKMRELSMCLEEYIQYRNSQMKN